MNYNLFDECFKEIIKVEGGYVNNPKDSGGETMYGITKATAKAFGYDGAMKSLPLSLAKQIYKERYWDALKLDDVQNDCPSVCLKLCDIAVNMGVKQAAFFLQRILNIMNKEGELYPDIVADGKVGNLTIRALKSYLSKRPKNGEVVMVRALNCFQGMFYITLAERRQKDEAFIFGWLANRIH